MQYFVDVGFMENMLPTYEDVKNYPHNGQVFEREIKEIIEKVFYKKPVTAKNLKIKQYKKLRNFLFFRF